MIPQTIPSDVESAPRLSITTAFVDAAIGYIMPQLMAIGGVALRGQQSPYSVEKCDIVTHYSVEKCENYCV